jgi:hypothetical protein
MLAIGDGTEDYQENFFDRFGFMCDKLLITLGKKVLQERAGKVR